MILGKGTLPGMYTRRVPIPGIILGMADILIILSNFSKVVYQVGCPFLGSPLEWQISLESLVTFPRVSTYQVGCPFLGSSKEWQGILRILSKSSKGVYQVECPFLGSSQELRGILRILSKFSKGVYQVGCPFLGSSRECRGILRILSNFSKGVYIPGRVPIPGIIPGMARYSYNP